jgi:CheY-like chemotaxis protein
MSSPPRAQVLVVDDDAALRALVVAVLSQAGYEVVAAADGLTALNLIRQQRHWRPDLILLDLEMPGLDGWAFAARYRELPGWHAPLVVVSAHPDAQEDAMRLRAADVLPKPFDLDELLTRLARLARSDRRAA